MKQEWKVLADIVRENGYNANKSRKIVSAKDKVAYWEIMEHYRQFLPQPKSDIRLWKERYKMAWIMFVDDVRSSDGGNV